MPIEFPCTACAAQLRVPGTAAGRVVRCGRCQATFRAPAPASAPTPAPEPTPPPSPAPDPAPVAVSPPAGPVPPAVTPAPAATLPPAELIPPAAPAPVPVPDDVPPPSAPPPPATETSDTDPPKPPVKRARARPSRPPRESRKERAKSASSTLGKVLLAVAVLGVLLAAAAGYFVWRTVNRSIEWETYESARGGYSVKMPAPPRDDMGARTNFRQTNPQARVEGTLHRGNEYTVAWADVRDGRNLEITDEQVISAAINGLKEEFKDGRVEVGEPITLDGLPAREVTITIPGDAVFVVRVIAAGSRVYVVGAGGGGGPQSETNARRFIDSFAITDPEVKAGAKRREEEAQRRRDEETRRKEALLRQAELERQAEIERIREERKWKEKALAEAEAGRKRLEAIAEAEQKRRQNAEAEAEKFRAVQAGVSAPDPTKLPGLKLYLSFDDVKGNVIPAWPQNALPLPKELSIGSGVRGRALYFSAEWGGLGLRPELLPETVLTGPCTIAGWVKAKPLYGVDLCHFVTENYTASTGVARRKGKFAAYSRLNTATIERHPAEESGRQLSAPCPDDEKWHHVVLTRDKLDWENRVSLYLDGELVAFFNFSAGRPENVKQLWLGLLTGVEGGVRRPPEPDSFPELPVAAADEICLFDRALPAHEVKYLAGKADSPAPPDPVRVRLVEGGRIEPVVGVAFDLERKTVWAISEINGYWAKSDEVRPDQTKDASLLLRYSYPDFKLTGKWALPKNGPRDRFASAPVLDPKNNRLYTALGPVGNSHNSLQREPDREGKFFRFDLNKLPEWAEGMPPPRLKEDVSLFSSLGRSAGDAAISPDGEWLYFTNRSRGLPLGWGVSVVRVPASLRGVPKEISVPTYFSWGHWLWMSPDGKAVRVLQSGRPDPGGAGPAGLLEIRTDDWSASPLKDVYGLDLGVSDQVRPVAFHPDGRVFIGSPAGVFETTCADGGSTRRLRPLPVRPTGFMTVSADGRFLFAADAQMKKNRLVVLDARANSTQLEELAVLDESANLRVGGRPFASPDGQFVVFRSGLVVRVDDGGVIEKKGAVKPVPSEQVAVAPMPRVVPPRPPVSPADLPGLTFYLDCEEYDGETVLDRVSKGLVGRAHHPRLVEDGPRGRALRFKPAPANSLRPYSGLWLSSKLVRADAGKPFTLALWARCPVGEPPRANTTILAYDEPRIGKARLHLSIAYTPNGGVLFNLNHKGRVIARLPGPAVESGEWAHFLVARDGANAVHFFVNGQRVQPPQPQVFDGALEGERVSLGWVGDGQPAIDVDDFCMFDRALTTDEVAWLAKSGPRAASPKSEVGLAPMPQALAQSRHPPPPPATDFKGLRFYLSFDQIDGDNAIDAVSKKSAGTLRKPELIDGPRGKAVSVTSERNPQGGQFSGLALKPGLMNVDAEKPFTLALWVRRSKTGPPDVPITVLRAKATPNDKEKRPQLLQISFQLNESFFFSWGDGQNSVGVATARLPEKSAWAHLVVRRNEKNEIHYFLNGSESPATRQVAFPGALHYDECELVNIFAGKRELDIDEFCLFDRALTDGEVAALAGHAKK